MSEREVLQRLFGAAYLGEDWNVIYGSPEQALAQFVRWHPEEASRLPADIETFMATTSSEDELADELDALGCAYSPSAEGKTYREWLIALVTETRRLLSKPEPPPSHLPELDPTTTRQRWVEARRDGLPNT